MHLMGRRSLTALAIGLLLPLAACSDDTPEVTDIKPGDTVEGRLDDIDAGKPADVVTPAGRLSVAFADPITSLTKDQTTDLTARDAPDGGSFVPIVWSYDDNVFGDVARVFGEREALQIDVKVGDQKYDLPPPSPGTQKSADYLAVDGEGKDISLEVTYGEVTQTLDAETGEVDKGVAARLYELADTKVKIKNCPVGKWLKNPTDYVQFKCQYTTAIASPYVANTWAKPGHTWLAVNVATTLVLFATGSIIDQAIANYDVTDVTDQSTVDGERPLGTLEERENGGTSSGIMVWDIKGALPKTVDVLREYKLNLSGAAGDTDAPQRRTAKVGGELTLLY